MKIDFKNKKKLQIMIFVLIGVITLGVGYAAISAINLVISGNASGSPSQNSFSVVFKSASVTTGTGTATIDQNDVTVAYFDVSGLSKTGDTAVATYTIRNESNGVGASIQLNVTNSNTEYFQITEAIVDTELQANEQTTATITVQMIKTPITDSVSTSITGTLIATPMENANATGSSSATATPLVGPQYKYSISSNTIGQSLVGELPSFEAAKTAFGHSISTAHIVNSGVITESYIVFEKNNTVYYLRGGVNELSSTNKPVYDANVNTLRDVFGMNLQSCTSGNRSILCNTNSLEVYISTSGQVAVSDYRIPCDLIDDNSIAPVCVTATSKCYVTNQGSANCSKDNEVYVID